MTSVADYSDCEVVRAFAKSKDGTMVPLNIIKRKSATRNGANPTILYAYGGYGISETPNFSASRRIWLDQGGIYVTAAIRGGGEYGDQWHLDGNLLKKQNDYDDFYACARWLIDQGYTSPAKLGILGGSNGGLLMGAALTQHPELYRAVVSMVGIYDMLRVELTTNGAFNVTEYGRVRDPDQFRALYGYSPVSPRGRRREISVDPPDDRRQRPAGRPLALPEVLRPAAGGQLVRQSDPSAHQQFLGPRNRQLARRDHRRADRYVRLPDQRAGDRLPAGRIGLALSRSAAPAGLGWGVGAVTRS